MLTRTTLFVIVALNYIIIGALLSQESVVSTFGIGWSIACFVTAGIVILLTIIYLIRFILYISHRPENARSAHKSKYDRKKRR